MTMGAVLAWHAPDPWTTPEISKALGAIRRDTRLERLTLLTSSEGSAAFVCAFQTTLADLELNFTQVEHWGSNFLLERGTCFAKLEQIRLARNAEVCSDVLASIRSVACPALRSIEIEIRRKSTSSDELAYHLGYVLPVLETFVDRQPALTVTTACHSTRTRHQTRSCDRTSHGIWPVSEVPQGESLCPPMILQDPLEARDLSAALPDDVDDDNDDDDGDDSPPGGVAEELLSTASGVLLDLLDGIRSMVEGAEVMGDLVQFTRIARALQGCEYLWLQQRM